MFTISLLLTPKRRYRMKHVVHDLVVYVGHLKQPNDPINFNLHQPRAKTNTKIGFFCLAITTVSNRCYHEGLKSFFFYALIEQTISIISEYLFFLTI